MRLHEITKIDKNEIEKVLKKYNIKNYTIHDDGTVDVEGDVNLSNRRITRFPVNFGKVTGEFNCFSCMALETLQGAPKSVGEDFNCHFCPKLTSLQGAPEKVGKTFNCTNCNNLMSLQGAPRSVGVGFYCHSCPKLTSLQGAPRSVGDNFGCSGCHDLVSLYGAPKSIGTSFICYDCPKLKVILPVLKIRQLKAFEMDSVNAKIYKIIKKYLPTNDIFGARAELIEAGFEEYARIK